MQTLFIPEIIKIDIIDQEGNPFRQENVLLGIKTFATHKNDIDIFPFLTDNQGHITITKELIQIRADNYISYGLMDYVGLEYAKPNIKVYYWGNDRLEKYIKHWTIILKNQSERLQFEEHGEIMGKIAKQLVEIYAREKEELYLFETSFNRKTNQKLDKILATDVWDKPAIERRYEVTLSV